MKPFTLLWIDDEQANIDLLKQKVQHFVLDRSDGKYQLNILDRRTYDAEVLELVGKAEINLVVTDLNLLDGKSGAEFVKQIVDNEIYKDVLLYSSDSKALRLAIEKLDGIFYFAFTDIYGLLEKINSVIWQCLVKEEYVLARHEL